MPEGGMAASATNQQQPGSEGAGGQKRPRGSIVRSCAGERWVDSSLLEWPENDIRLFVGDVGNDVTDEMLCRAFSKYPSFARGKVVRDHRTDKTKGFGFVSFLEPADALLALKEMHGQYIGLRPITLSRSKWAEKSIGTAHKERQNKRPKHA
jgi:hypothetical protein